MHDTLLTMTAIWATVQFARIIKEVWEHLGYRTESKLREKIRDLNKEIAKLKGEPEEKDTFISLLD